MSTENKPADADKKAETAPPAAKGGAVGGLLKIIIPAVLAAGAAYGGTRAASAHSAVPAAEHVEEKKHVELKPPGPTLPLDPFLVTLTDSKGKTHPMKLTLAIEFESDPNKKKGGEEGGNESDEFKGFVPRMRDSILGMLRTRSYEDMTDTERTEKFREEILDKVQKSGAKTAEKILVTDMVVQ